MAKQRRGARGSSSAVGRLPFRVLAAVGIASATAWVVFTLFRPDAVHWSGPAHDAAGADDEAAAHGGERRAGSAAESAKAQTQAGSEDRVRSLVVALAVETPQILGAAVVFHSLLKHTKRPEAVRLRVLTLANDSSAVLAGLRRRLPVTVDLKAVAFDAWQPRVARLLGGNATLRQELDNVLNFAAFYLHELFPGEQRVLYLDTDVVVLRDVVSELMRRDLQGQPLAGAMDCSQRVNKYLRYDRLKKPEVMRLLPRGLKEDWRDWKACVINRGVVLIDVERWAAANITGTIEALVALHMSDGPLWRSGASQPPFLMAVSGYYHDLGPEYNVRGLGRTDISPLELEHYRNRKIWRSYLDGFLMKCKYNCCPGCKDFAYAPYISPLTHKAKIIHFNGRLKPMANRPVDPFEVQPPPRNLDAKARAARELRPLCSCGKTCLRECSGVWWEHLPPERLSADDAAEAELPSATAQRRDASSAESWAREKKTLAIGGACCILTVVAVRPDMPKMLLLVLVFLGKGAISLAFAVVYLYATELFPTTLRSSSMGLQSLFARFGGMLAPAVASMGKVSQALPLIIFGVPCAISALLLLCLPETRGQPMPDTLDDIQMPDSQTCCLFGRYVELVEDGPKEMTTRGQRSNSSEAVIIGASAV
eukprot:TRINITY_DN26023_c0_g4_i2.p1 TRINITY_DN26023_c0_g4~~TRINITY_DN26023_c0_g4_i2.p1  ORF type:complete len:683 (+),score=114.46 TRINITY_DN26023_c0_g4_i2:99-2051(+)